jgi:aspartate 1-decarboxylase
MFIKKLEKKGLKMKNQYLITTLKSKIHRAVTTDSQLDYIGSIEIDKSILDKVGVKANEQVHIVNLSNGKRWITYALPAKEGSKIFSVNGGGARLAIKGDILIIMAYAQIPEDFELEPKILIFDENNDVLIDND